MPGIVVSMMLRVVSCFLGMLAISSAHASILKGTPWENVAMAHGIDPILIYSVALVEAAHVDHEGARPHPFAVNGPEGARYFNDWDSAAAYVRAYPRPADLDLGAMQINLRWHGARVADPTALLDPMINLQVGAAILCEALASAPDDLELAIGHYHSADPPRARAYGRKVLAVYARLLAADGESWQAGGRAPALACR